MNTCVICQKNFTTKIVTKNFCSSKCYNTLKYNERLTLWISDKVIIKRNTTLKKYLIDHYGHQCNNCKLSSWNDQPIPLEVEHINGNSSDNAFINLKLLCPNCHAQTDTYKSKNLGNGRHFRRERYKNGKSY